MIEDRFRVEPADWTVDQTDLKFVRTEVFILGQNIPEAEEWDELDARSIHVIARDNDAAVQAWTATFAPRGIAFQPWPLAESFDWTAEEDRNSPLVPPPALAAMMKAIRD